jgi:hypothetical protein
MARRKTGQGACAAIFERLGIQIASDFGGYDWPARLFFFSSSFRPPLQHFVVEIKYLKFALVYKYNSNIGIRRNEVCGRNQ